MSESPVEHLPSCGGLRRTAGRLLLAFLFTGCAAATAQVAMPLLDLDAAALAAGPVRSWPNAGTLGGAFTATDESAPAASDVGGRRAVTFGDGHFLASSVKAPAAITGDHPFTLAVMAFAAEPVKRDVMVSWASRPNNSAEFGYGAGPDGAFFGWDKSARFSRPPAPGQWHPIAYSYDGEGMVVYVDGAPDARRPMKLATKPGGTIYLGAGWNGVDQKPAFPFHGSLARVRVWDRALSHREVRNDAGSFEAFDAAPADGATVAAEGLRLRWQTGSDRAKSYVVRLAPLPAAASEASAALDAAPGRRVETPELLPPDSMPGRSYAWRVDQLDADGKVIAPGTAWRFTTDSGPPNAPFPRDRVAGVPADAKELHWTPGRYAQSQTVYFGADREAVAGGSAAAAKSLPAKAGTLPVPVPHLEPGKTYYWRVEEDNGPLPSAKGDVWAFRTADEPVKDDVTFFVGSDCHYGLGNNDELNRRVIDEMNWLPGTPMPQQAGGGQVGTPRGVVLDGDLLDKGFDPKTAPPAWAEFVQDYGLNGRDGRLGFPVYEGFGNHDGMTGKSVSRAAIKARNQSRVGLTAVSSNGFHYSWDWDHVHCDQLNLFPGKDSADCIVGPPNHDPEDALGFLKEDLSRRVGNSGKVVVIFCHYCYSGGMADWWTDAAKDRFFEAVKDYRVILIHGHSHGAYFYTWKGLQAVSDGATARPEGQTGDFLVVHITPTDLCVAQRKLDGWGITLKTPLPRAGGAPAGREAGAVHPNVPRERLSSIGPDLIDAPMR